MASASSPDIQLSRAAARQFKKLPVEVRTRVRKALAREAERIAGASRGRGGKSVKTIRGRSDQFRRLRIGEYRAMFDWIEEDNVLLVLGIVHRRDLESWLRR